MFDLFLTCTYPPNQLTQWSTVLLTELTVPQLIKKLPALYGTRRLTAIFNTPPPDPTLNSHQTSPRTPKRFKTHFHSILPPTNRSSKWSPNTISKQHSDQSVEYESHTSPFYVLKWIYMYVYIYIYIYIYICYNSM